MATVDRREYWRIQARKYRAANPERVKAISRRTYHRHRDKAIESQRRWRLANGHVIRNAKFLRHYGITWLDYLGLAEKQNGVCAICKQPETATWKGVVRRLAIDHDHISGKVRGLLCQDCNVSLGKMKESPSILRMAAAYLEQFATDY